MEKIILKKIDITKDTFKGANPMMMGMINTANKSFSLLKKLGEGLEKEGAKAVLLVFDKEAPRDSIENPPFTIYMCTDDLSLRIKQLEYQLEKALAKK